MVIEQRFYDTEIRLWKWWYEDHLSQFSESDVSTIIQAAKDNLLGETYPDIEVSLEENGTEMYLRVGYNINDPYYVVDDICYYPGCKATYDSPAEPPELEGFYEDATELWGDFFKHLPEDVDAEVIDGSWDVAEDIYARMEDTSEPDPDRLYEEWRDKQLFDN